MRGQRFGTYLLGALMLGTPPGDFHIELSLDWALNELTAIWIPLFVGSLTVGIVLAVSGYLSIQLAWRMHVASNWKKRKLNRERRQNSDTPPTP